MTDAITVSIPHRLGAEAAKKRVSERIEQMRRDYMDKIARSEVSWSGDTANLQVWAMGQTATAKIDVLADALNIEVRLPWILAALSGKIRDVLASNAKDSLRLGPPKA